MPLPSKDKTSDSFVAHPGQKKSFQLAEARAREVLQEKGMSDQQIDAELRRATRAQDD